MNAQRIKVGTGQRHGMKRCIAAACITAAFWLAAIAPATAITSAATTHAAKNNRSAQSVAKSYFQVFNGGMASGNFSGLATVFAANATLTKSGTDGKTTVYHGLTEITGFYQGLHDKLAGWQWTTDEMRPLTRNIVVAYEHAGSPPLSIASRCVHVFQVKKGKIVSYDWAAFFPGQK